MTDFERLRVSEWPELSKGGIFLNSASVGPMPRSSLAALATANADRAIPQRWTMDRTNATLQGARERFARLIGAGSEEIALMPNTSIGLNVAARAAGLGPGDIALTFAREFPSNVYPWLAMARDGVKLELIDTDQHGWPNEELLHQRLTDPRVRAVCVSLTQFSNGYTLDLAALSEATRRTNTLLIVDAIQALGQVPVDVGRVEIDFLAAGAQKWLLSPWGTGFLYVRRELIQDVTPTFAGWASFRGSDDYTQLTSYNPEPWPDARRFELITLPIQDFDAANASLDLLMSVGIGHINAQLAELASPLIDWARQNGAEVTSPSDARRSAITCIRPRGDVRAVYQRLSDSGVVCSLREGSIRFAPHLFNNPAEIEVVVGAMS